MRRRNNGRRQRRGSSGVGRWRVGVAALVGVLLLAACGQGVTAQTSPQTGPLPPPDTYEVVHRWAHAPDAFTEGLVYDGGILYESTGLNGESSLRRVELTTGRVLDRVDVPAEFFGEGLALLNGTLYQLTWQSQRGFIYDLGCFCKTGEFRYTGEGWGLTTDGQSLILTDGTPRIRFLDPRTFAVTRTVDVTFNGRTLYNLNEAEYVRGEIYANIWQTNFIARIDPATGAVRGLIDLSGLLPEADQPGTDVLNGIAYDPATDRLFVTGKNWPALFEIRVKRAG